jgi:hypothetical protein
MRTPRIGPWSFFVGLIGEPLLCRVGQEMLANLGGKPFGVVRALNKLAVACGTAWGKSN